MRHLPATGQPLLLEIAPHLERRIDEHLDFDTRYHEIASPASRTFDHHHGVEIAAGISLASQSRTARQYSEQVGAELRAKPVHHEFDDRQVIHTRAPSMQVGSRTIFD